jgi:hypothetical protein
MLLDELSDREVSKLWDLSRVVCASPHHACPGGCPLLCRRSAEPLPAKPLTVRRRGWGCAQRQKSPVQWDAATNFQFNLNSEVRLP